MHGQTPGKIGLVSTSHSGYRAWCRALREKKESGRRRDPFAQDYNAELLRWEAVVQRLLATVVPDTVDERILVAPDIDRKGKASSIYRELDFVSGHVSAPDMFGEIKIREQSIKGKSGWGQLDRSLQIARTQWPMVRGICINVALGDILETEPECNNPTVTLSELPGVIAERSQQDGATVWIRGSDVASFAMEQNLLTLMDIQRLPQLRQAMQNPVHFLKTRDLQPETIRPGLFERFRPSH